jgi:hypothetical protein
MEGTAGQQGRFLIRLRAVRLAEAKCVADQLCHAAAECDQQPFRKARKITDRLTAVGDGFEPAGKRRFDLSMASAYRNVVA